MIMAPQPWVNRRPAEGGKKVVGMGRTCSACSMGPPQKGIITAPQPWLNRRSIKIDRKNQHGVPHPRQNGFLMAPQPWMHKLLIEINWERLVSNQGAG